MIQSVPKTIICDIDGTLTKHANPSEASKPDYVMKLLDGTLEKLLEWEKKGYRIILLTGRKESLRDNTVKQLREVGIFYDQLIMGVGGGERYLINDNKPNSAQTAFAITTQRNVGISNINI
jgi:phosphoglycolate phosphatase-like HAD superfamily hydrolase